MFVTGTVSRRIAKTQAAVAMIGRGAAVCGDRASRMPNATGPG
jgi:hypothetical protein